MRKAIGPIATPDVIHWAPGLPKTRSGEAAAGLLRCAALRCDLLCELLRAAPLSCPLPTEPCWL